MTPGRLAELEGRFLRLISQPKPLLDAAHTLFAHDTSAGSLAGWLVANSDEEAATRLGIYAHMYFARLRDSLREDFPHCAELVGPERFDQLATKYLLRHPSDNPSLRYHGRHFPGFIRALIALEAEPALRPDLAELCELEWARLDVFDAADVATLDSGQLATLRPYELADLTLRAVPALRVLELRFAVDALWSASDTALPVPEVQARAQTLLVWRRGFRVYHRAVHGAEARALRALRQGARFADLCELFVEDSTLERAAERCGACLKQWLADAIVYRSPARDPAWVAAR